MSHDNMNLREVNIDHGEVDGEELCAFKINCHNNSKLRWCEEGVCGDLRMVVLVTHIYI